jgi:hypothetical protein
VVSEENQKEIQNSIWVWLRVDGELIEVNVEIGKPFVEQI